MCYVAPLELREASSWLDACYLCTEYCKYSMKLDVQSVDALQHPFCEYCTLDGESLSTDVSRCYTKQIATYIAALYPNGHGGVCCAYLTRRFENAMKDQCYSPRDGKELCPCLSWPHTHISAGELQELAPSFPSSTLTRPRVVRRITPVTHASHTQDH